MELPEYSWLIESELDPVALRSVLDSYRPYRHEVNFSSGFSTREFGDALIMPNSIPLAKLHYFESQVAVDATTRILDIGCNLGFYCQYFIRAGVHSAVGVEFSDRLHGAAMLLRTIAGLSYQNYVLIHGDFADMTTQHAVEKHGPYDVILF